MKYYVYDIEYGRRRETNSEMVREMFQGLGSAKFHVSPIIFVSLHLRYCIQLDPVPTEGVYALVFNSIRHGKREISGPRAAPLKKARDYQYIHIDCTRTESELGWWRSGSAYDSNDAVSRSCGPRFDPVSPQSFCVSSNRFGAAHLALQ
jgi:hypothetical protein